jgi:hypothetical protein
LDKAGMVHGFNAFYRNRRSGEPGLIGNARESLHFSDLLLG